MQLNPAGKLAGTVIVTALLLEQTMIIPLSDAANVWMYQIQFEGQLHTQSKGYHISTFPVPWGAMSILLLDPSLITIEPVFVALSLV